MPPPTRPPLRSRRPESGIREATARRERGGKACCALRAGDRGVGGTAGETILVAEDDRVAVELLSLWLEADGFTVARAADGMQVIMTVRCIRPAAILLDLMMPGGTGFDVLTRLHSNAARKGVPVVAMSASANPDLPHKALQSGADGFLCKPVAQEELLATIRGVLGRREGPFQENSPISRRSAMSSGTDSRDDVSPKPGATPGPEGRGQAAAARVWAQFHDVIFERLAAVETAANALRGATLTSEVRQKGVLEAHRLAGSLGMFGLADGTQVAREIEHLLGEQGVLTPEAPHRLIELSAALRQMLEKGPA